MSGTPAESGASAEAPGVEGSQGAAVEGSQGAAGEGSQGAGVEGSQGAGVEGSQGAAGDGLVEAGDEPVVRLLRWRGPWPDDDPDGNLKADVAIYADADPLVTLTGLAGAVDVPVGALARYVLAKWATGGSEGLLELGPSTVARMRELVDDAERAGTDDARLAAYDVLRQQVSWLAAGLDGTP